MKEFKKRAKATHKTPKKAFVAFDRTDEEDGELSAKEFEEGAGKLEPHVSEDDAKEIFAKMDKDGNEGISTEEFFEATGGRDDCEDEFIADGVSIPDFNKRAEEEHETPE